MALATGMVAAVGFGGGTMIDTPDARHAWALEDGNCPLPDLVTTRFGGLPSDAVPFDSASEVKAELAADCQLHFAAKSPAKLAFFGAEVLDGRVGVVARGASDGPTAGDGSVGGLSLRDRQKDGWIVYDVVFHRSAEGHEGQAMVFVNGVFAKEEPVKSATGKTPLALVAKDLAGGWIRRTPAPWSIRTHGRYADAKVVAETRERTAAALLADYRTREWPARLPEAERLMRKTNFAVQIYSYSTNAPYAAVFNEACVEFQKLVEAGKVSKGQMTSVSRAILPLRNHGIVRDDYPLVKALADHGVKGW